MEKCIEFHAGKWKNAVNSFEKDFFKLINNSVYGKRIESLRKRLKVILVNNAKDK